MGTRVHYCLVDRGSFFHLGPTTANASVFPLTEDVKIDSDACKALERYGITFLAGHVDVAAVYKFCQTVPENTSSASPEQYPSEHAQSARRTLVEYRFFTWWDVGTCYSEPDESESVSALSPFMTREGFALLMDMQRETGDVTEMESPDGDLEARVLEGGSIMRRTHTLRIPAGCKQLCWVYAMKDAKCHVDIGKKLGIDPCDYERDVGLYSITDPDKPDPSEYRLIFELYDGVNEA
jgi:hypothetical protein